MSNLVSNSSESEREYKEVRIKVPWGFLAGKWYGPKDIRPILALHGWQDNANTFNTLVPLMPSYMGVLCVDLPGHGLTSHFPEGIFYHSLDYILCIIFIMREYNWKKVSIMGHSLCSMLGFVFAGIFPDKVDFLIGIDLLKPRYKTPSDQIDIMRYKFDKFLIAEERRQESHLKEPPTFSYDELNEKLYEGSDRSIDKEKCYHILNRNILKSLQYPEKFYFRRDEKIKFYDEFTVNSKYSFQLAKNIKAPFLSIKGGKSAYLGEDDFDEIIKILKENNQDFYLKYVPEGTHHFHLNNPNEVAEFINPFVQKYRPPIFELQHKL